MGVNAINSFQYNNKVGSNFESTYNIPAGMPKTTTPQDSIFNSFRVNLGKEPFQTKLDALDKNY